VSDGEQTFHASIDDERFRARVDVGQEAFRKGDMLRCQIEMIQTQRTSGLHTERRIVKVLEHIPRDIQLSIDDADPLSPPRTVDD